MYQYSLSCQGVQLPHESTNPLSSGNPQMSTKSFANNEDPDEMQHYTLFVNVKTDLQTKEYNILLEIIT